MSSHSVQNYVNTIRRCVWEKLVKPLFIRNMKSVFLLLDQSPCYVVMLLLGLGLGLYITVLVSSLCKAVQNSQDSIHLRPAIVLPGSCARGPVMP